MNRKTDHDLIDSLNRASIKNNQLLHEKISHHHHHRSIDAIFLFARRERFLRALKKYGSLFSSILRFRLRHLQIGLSRKQSWVLWCKND